VKLLKDKILAEGKALNNTILKVDSFINHQVDPNLMCEVGKSFSDYFKSYGITKVLTIESSGIAPAVYAAQFLNVPMVILKKQTSKILNDTVYQTNITSFTKGTSYELTLSKNYINATDNVLIIDDFLANGEAAAGAVRLTRMADAKIAGIGILIEKSFQKGRQRLIDDGLLVHSLVRVERLAEGVIEFVT